MLNFYRDIWRCLGDTYRLSGCSDAALKSYDRCISVCQLKFALILLQIFLTEAKPKCFTWLCVDYRRHLLSLAAAVRPHFFEYKNLDCLYNQRTWLSSHLFISILLLLLPAVRRTCSGSRRPVCPRRSIGTRSFSRCRTSRPLILVPRCSHSGACTPHSRPNNRARCATRSRSRPPSVRSPLSPRALHLCPHSNTRASQLVCQCSYSV